DRMRDFAAFDPESRRTARIVAGDHVDTLPKQVGNEEAGTHLLQKRREVSIGRIHAEIVISTRIAGGPQDQLARGITAEEITLQDAVLNDVARAGCNTFVVERAAGQALENMRPVVDLHYRRKHLLAETIEKERRLAIQAAATDCGDEMAKQPRSDRRL